LDQPGPNRGGEASPVRQDETGHLAQDTPCASCGYNLRGIALESRCPECGTSVGRSIRSDFMRYCHPAWVERLAAGMSWIIMSVLLGIVFGLVANLVERRAGNDTLTSVLGLVSPAIGLVGAWMVTTPDQETRRRHPDQGRSRDLELHHQGKPRRGARELRRGHRHHL
jgi:predicted RNA-binding Zn-ribbon protein involved in translation (DUF1610 family)